MTIFPFGPNDLNWFRHLVMYVRTDHFPVSILFYKYIEVVKTPHSTMFVYIQIAGCSVLCYTLVMAFVVGIVAQYSIFK